LRKSKNKEQGGSVKILLVSTMIFGVPPTGYGGLEGVVEDLAVELIKLGHKVSIVCPKGSNVPGAELIMPCEASFANPEGEAYNAYKEALEAGNWDICHDHSWAGFPYLSKQKNPKLKVIHTIHSQRSWGTPPLGVKYPCLVGASKFQAQHISATLGVHAEYVYHGINLETYKFCQDKEDYLLYCARVTPFKGAHEFVALCKRLGMPGRLVGEDVYIDQQDHAFVRRVMDSCDGKQIIYEGRVPRGSDTMVELMGKAKLMISPLLPDYYEIFGLSTIESMACGTAVVSTDRGAARELITPNTGMVVPDIHGLDDAVKTLLDRTSPDRAIPEACRARAEHFDRKFMAENYVKLYERALADSEW
jgi:glycosyltransferase involved in cell wall biosynthesis